MPARRHRHHTTSRRARSHRRGSSGPIARIPVVPVSIREAVTDNPLFQELTSDGAYWIDPYTGNPVQVMNEDPQDTALTYLAKQRSWEQYDLLALTYIREARWRVDLNQLLPTEPCFRLFLKRGNGWLNPYSGAIEEGVEKESGRISAKTIDAMAAALAACPAANTGQMLAREELRERFAKEERSYGSDELEIMNLSRYRDADLVKARDVQANMLSDLPTIDGYDLALHFEPHSGVSGDFYDFYEYPDGRLLLILGDVAGHGVQAALVVSSLLKALRIIRRDAKSLVDLVARLNDEVREEMLVSQFTTMFAAILDPDSGSMEVALAGHHPAFLVNARGPQLLRKVGKPGMVLGVTGGDVFRKSIVVEKVALQPGDILFQFSDGYFESTDSDEEQFGELHFAGQLLEIAEDATDIDEIIAKITREIKRFAAEIDDDLTMIGLGRPRD